MENQTDAQKPRAGPKPKDCLKRAENLAVGIRKHLKSFGTKRGFSSTGAAKDDAEALANHIEKLSVYGQKCSAAEAIEIADMVEVLCLVLSDEIDSLLASGNQQVR